MTTSTFSGAITSAGGRPIRLETILSGSHMLYRRHGAAPDISVFTDIRLDTPNGSGRIIVCCASQLAPEGAGR